MRLVCPNCAAQYEVADNAIPTAGRNVQCANCENTWFQEPANAAKSKQKQTAPEDGEKSAGRRNLRKKKPQGDSAEGLSPEQVLAAEAAQDAAADDGEDTGPRAGIRPKDGGSDNAPAVDQSVLDILRKDLGDNPKLHHLTSLNSL